MTTSAIDHPLVDRAIWMPLETDAPRRVRRMDRMSISRREFDGIVHQEHLERWLVRSEPTGTTSGKLCVFEKQGVWYTVMTDERAVLMAETRRSFASESEALTDALEGLRLLKDLRTSRP